MSMSPRKSSLPPVGGGAMTVLLACVSLAAAPGVRAQLFSYGRTAQPRAATLSIAWQAVDFRPDESNSPEGAPMFAGPAYGVTYARGNISSSVTYGSRNSAADGDARLLDVSIAVWSRLFGVGAPGRSRLYFPLTLQTNYRRVAPKGQANSPFGSFQATAIALGAGFGGSAARGKRVLVEARAAPALGVAMRSFGGSVGLAWLADASAQLHIREAFGRFGASAGYGFRAQSWGVGEANLLLEPGETRLDYFGLRHMIALGLNW